MAYEPALIALGIVFTLLLIFSFWVVIRYERQEAKRREERMIHNMMEALKRFEENKNGGRR